MSKFLFTIFMSLPIFQLAANNTLATTETQAGNYGITFDDFPNNSLPDFDAVNSFSLEKSVDEFNSKINLDEIITLQSELALHSSSLPGDFATRSKHNILMLRQVKMFLHKMLLNS